MLAPGEFLTRPVPPEQSPQQSATDGRALTPPTVKVAKLEEPEPRSFLSILLNALGAIHT
jgi:hypothetical protein